MDEFRVYAGAFSAIQFSKSGEGLNRIGSMFVRARSENEAYGVVMKQCQKLFPLGEGWRFHNVSISEYDRDKWEDFS